MFYVGATRAPLTLFWKGYLVSRKLTVLQAAKQSKLSKQTIQRYALNGVFPSAEKINSQWIIDEIDIENLKVQGVVQRNRTKYPPIGQKELLLRRVLDTLAHGNLPDRGTILQMIAFLSEEI